MHRKKSRASSMGIGSSHWRCPTLKSQRKILRRTSASAVSENRSDTRSVLTRISETRQTPVSVLSEVLLFCETETRPHRTENSGRSSRADLTLQANSPRVPRLSCFQNASIPCFRVNLRFRQLREVEIVNFSLCAVIAQEGVCERAQLPTHPMHRPPQTSCPQQFAAIPQLCRSSFR